MVSSLIKKIVSVIIICIVILILGSVSIDARQNVVVTNMVTKKQYVLTKGLHFVWPAIEKVDYVFMNTREGLFTFSLPFNDNTNAQISVAIKWQVINPSVYLLVRDDIHKKLADNVVDIVEARIKTTDISTFNQLNNLITEPIVDNELGIEILNISLNQLKIESSNDKIQASTNNKVLKS